MDRTLYISGQLGLNHLAELVPGGVERETEKVTPFAGPHKKRKSSTIRSHRKIGYSRQGKKELRNKPNENLFYSHYHSSRG